MGTLNRRIAIRDARAARKAKARTNDREIRSLSVRVDYEEYRRLKQFLDDHHDQSGQKISHQEVLEIALLEYLEQHDPIC